MDLAIMTRPGTAAAQRARPVDITVPDYEIVCRTIAYISRRWREQPSLERIADHVGMKPLALQRLFTRWAGLSPKSFVQALTLDHARTLLDRFGLGARRRL